MISYSTTSSKETAGLGLIATSLSSCHGESYTIAISLAPPETTRAILSRK